MTAARTPGGVAPAERTRLPAWAVWAAWAWVLGGVALFLVRFGALLRG